MLDNVFALNARETIQRGSGSFAAGLRDAVAITRIAERRGRQGERRSQVKRRRGPLVGGSEVGPNTRCRIAAYPGCRPVARGRAPVCGHPPQPDEQPRPTSATACPSLRKLFSFSTF